LPSPSDLERERAEIYAAYGLSDCPPRFATLRRPNWPTFGGRVALVASQLGTPFMPWQRYVADVMLEVNPDTGLLWYRDTGCTVMRQCGKTTIVLPWFCWRGMTTKGARMVYAAQNHVSARKKWEDDQLPMLEDVGWIPRQDEPLQSWHKARVRRAHGSEGIIWRRTRAIHMLQASTERAGHGTTKVHQVAKDEYFSQVDDRIDVATGPAMITVPDHQNSWWSTAGTTRSVPMNEAIRVGRELVEAGDPATRTAYFEWSRPRDADRSDPDIWLSTIPGLCPDDICHCAPNGQWRHSFSVSSLRSVLEGATTPAKRADFDRAYGNIPREDDAPDGDPNMPEVEEWDVLGDAGLEGRGGDGLACAIDVTPSEDHAAIVAVGEGAQGPGGPPIVVVLEHGPGTEWVPAAAARINAELRPVAWVLDDRSRSRVLIQPLKNAGIVEPTRESERERGQLWLPSTADVGACSARLVGVVRRGEIAHLGQLVLRAAMVGTRTRNIGDGLFAFGRRVSGADITTWVGASLALGGYERFAHLAVPDPDYELIDSIG
jgi:hypothetical protein